jgi:hypothetical protein
MGREVKATSWPLYPGTHCIGGLVDPRAGLDGKYRLSPGFSPRTVQPEASRYINCAIQAHYVIKIAD